jgi:hypothetical protein
MNKFTLNGFLSFVHFIVENNLCELVSLSVSLKNFNCYTFDSKVQPLRLAKARKREESRKKKKESNRWCMLKRAKSHEQSRNLLRLP